MVFLCKYTIERILLLVRQRPIGSVSTGTQITAATQEAEALIASVVAVTASACDRHKSSVPENVIDGNVTTNWAKYGIAQWITLELDTSYLVSKTRVSFSNYDQGRTYTYSIAVSNDNLSWINVVSNRTSSAARAVPAKYLL